MIKVAITGGIGSGKSTAAAILGEFGYKCESADKIYHELLSDEKFVEKYPNIWKLNRFFATEKNSR